MRRGLALVALVAGCAHAHVAPPAARESVATTCPDAAFRAHKPEPLPFAKTFAAPVPVERALENGVRVLVVENHAVPFVAVELVAQSGVADEPIDRGGLSGFVLQMLPEGTKARSAIELAVLREQLAAQLSTTNGPTSSSLHLNAPRETLPQALALLAEMVREPAFTTTDVERVRGVLLTELASKKGNAAALAKDELARALWGDTPLGLPAGGTATSIEAITTKELAAFHRAHWVPGNVVVVIAGDVTTDEAVAELERALGAWKKGARVGARTPTRPAASVRSIIVSERRGASQSQVWTGWIGPGARDVRMFPLMVASNILGGLFTSRLNSNLREQKGFSYGIRANVTPYRDASVFLAGGGIVAAHTVESIVEIENELVRLRRESFSDDEIERAKANIVLSLPSQLETNDAVAKAVAGLVDAGLPLDHFRSLPDRVRAIEKAEVASAVQSFIDAEHMPIVVVGDAAKDALLALRLGNVIHRRTP